MKKILSFLLLVILLISVGCTNNYRISNAKYTEEGRVFIGTLNFEGSFSPDNYDIDWTYKESDLLKPESATSKSVPPPPGISNSSI